MKILLFPSWKIPRQIIFWVNILPAFRTGPVLVILLMNIPLLFGFLPRSVASVTAGYST
jgi:hypothetical protein